MTVTKSFFLESCDLLCSSNDVSTDRGRGNPIAFFLEILHPPNPLGKPLGFLCSSLTSCKALGLVCFEGSTAVEGT